MERQGMDSRRKKLATTAGQLRNVFIITTHKLTLINYSINKQPFTDIQHMEFMTMCVA
ncbi:hypothetical protein SK355_03730 [Candidatus Fukatsuia symbiotica]|uniref:hypothetical protein n=1 Tax=Candidatus Fukatsuia TaxID=1927833 RepID=UPI0013C36B1F|nr:hypothetical protein [Candidatus Fukatsuia symbiotica]MEA9444430.1 hypothetical protein [Candidatus Fukatsuia symbiotica]